LCQEIKELAPGVEITLSELIDREDKIKDKKTVKEVNNLAIIIIVNNNNMFASR
jgi:hypothetical protein